MDAFPRTTVGGVSVSRLIIGTNWFLGWAHSTSAKSQYIKENVTDRKKIADIMEVFVKSGVDTVMGLIKNPVMGEAIRETEDRTGKKMIVVSTPSFTVTPETAAKGFDESEVAQVLDGEVELGATFCLPHQSITDKMLDRCTREFRHMDTIFRMTRERGMIPGLSTHTPETIIAADQTGIDIETYIQLYNAMGFLMQVEVDWIHRVIQNAKKPVMTIKPFAAGHIRPFQGLTFVWNTLRDCDMVTVGTMSPSEAAEVIEMSMGILERRHASVELQETRSKASLKPQG